MANKDSQGPIVIDVQGVKKKFRIYSDRGTTLKDSILFHNRRKYEDHWVLNGLSFQVHKGEAIGLIGENGCGKSTTLKMLSRILYPDEGSISITGRVSSLIELGAGFHPDLSGRENIYTNASIFGLKKQEIDKRLDEIIAFSGLTEYIDQPVRTYSSGMYTRLAFAVAINVDADILLIDEILAVGDAAFQAKCYKKLMEIKARGTTIVIVSHSLSQIEQICERSIWIDQGIIRNEGVPREVHPIYLEYMSKKNQKEENNDQEKSLSGQSSIHKNVKQKGNSKRWGSGEAKIESVEILNHEGYPQLEYSAEDSFVIKIHYYSEQELTNAVIGIAIYRSDNTFIFGTNTLLDTSEPVKLYGHGVVELRVHSFPVANGDYMIDLALHRPDGFDYDFWQGVCSVSIVNKIMTPGVISLSHDWIIVSEAGNEI